MLDDQPNKGGRPPKFESPEQFEQLAEAYFIKCASEDTPLTITGLALSLGTTRETLMDYENKDGFSYTVKLCKARVEEYAEKMLYLGKSAAGPIFHLKNMGWSDKTEQELYGKGGGPLQHEHSIKPEDKDIINRYTEQLMKERP